MIIPELKLLKELNVIIREERILFIHNNGRYNTFDYRWTY